MKLNRAILAALTCGGLATALVLSLSRNAGQKESVAGVTPLEPSISAPVPNPGQVVQASLPTALQVLAARLQSIQAETDSVRKELILEKAAAEIAAQDLPSAVAYFAQLDPSKSAQELNLRLVRRWASIAPQAAGDWVNENWIGAGRQEAINGIATVWANQNPDAAADWVGRLSEAEERQSALVSVAYEVARGEPLKAMKLGMTLPESESRDDLLSHTVAQWAAKSPSVAAAWAIQVSDDLLRERLVSGIATAWGETDPAAAAELAVKSLPMGRVQDDAVVGIVQRWAQTKPEAAAEWVSQFPAGQLRDTAMEELMKLWVDQDLERAGSWLLSHSDVNRDAAVHAYVSKITPSFPEFAARWTTSIDDEDLRLREMEAVGASWMETDAAAARAWIAQSSLNDSAKDRLLALKAR